MINDKPRPSFKTLIEFAGLKIGKINTTNIVFSLAPRINAVGRLGDAKRAVELLTSTDPEKQEELAQTLNDENVKRREFDKSITEEAFQIYESSNTNGHNQSIVLHNGDWHSGVIGIVAARLVEKYNKPAIVLTTVKGVAKGSARSINGFNIYEALKRCERLLIQFGGHYHAAGLEIELENIDEFRKEFNEIAYDEILKQHLQPEIEIDSEIELDELTPKMKKILSFFEPFGPGNMPPVFMATNVQVVGEVRYAKSDTHIFRLKQGKSHKILDAVFFSSPEYKDKIIKGAICDICFTVEKSIWNDIESYKLKIKDLKVLD
jgi:single-stranded-DNA-specific exonuclease